MARGSLITRTRDQALERLADQSRGAPVTEVEEVGLGDRRDLLLGVISSSWAALTQAHKACEEGSMGKRTLGLSLLVVGLLLVLLGLTADTIGREVAMALVVGAVVAAVGAYIARR